MPINFAPKRGQILMCDFDLATVPPEMRKVRRVIVVSPRSYNQRQGNSRPGRAIVVPLSASEPPHLRASHVPIPAGSYASATKAVWAICDCVAHVSHDRLDRVNVKGRFITEMATDADMARLESGLRASLGMG